VEFQNPKSVRAPEHPTMAEGRISQLRHMDDSSHDEYVRELNEAFMKHIQTSITSNPCIDLRKDVMDYIKWYDAYMGEEVEEPSIPAQISEDAIYRVESSKVYILESNSWKLRCQGTLSVQPKCILIRDPVTGKLLLSLPIYQDMKISNNNEDVTISTIGYKDDQTADHDGKPTCYRIQNAGTELKRVLLNLSSQILKGGGE
jgi:hypothetical protein